jgi:hypothetical protein
MKQMAQLGGFNMESVRTRNSYMMHGKILLFEIVARIKTECAIVHGNRELIRLYEEKVKKVIERVWEE